MTCAPLTYAAAADAIVAHALSCVGLSAHPSNDRARFAREVVPYGSAAWAVDLCKPTPKNGANSCCEVFGVGCEQSVAAQFGIAGHDHPLDAGGATAQWAREVALAKQLGAYRTIAKDGPPTRGALVRVEGPSSRHWFRVVERRPGLTPGTYLYTTVDGGQNDRGYQAIAKCEHAIRGGFELVNGVQGRPVVDWIDSPALLVALAAAGSPPAISSQGTSSSPIEGVDLSSSNPTPDPAALRAAGIRFGYVRLTIGLGSPDTRAAAHVRALRAAGCLVGGYGVPYPPRPFSGGQVDAVAQARELVGLHKALGLEGRLMIDAEEVTSGGRVVTATGAQHRDTLERYAETIIAEAGHDPILYTGAWWWNRFPELVASSLLTSLDSWVADYSNAPALIHPNGISEVLVHQYAGSDPKGRLGIIPGVAGYIDRNHLFAPLERLRA